MVTWPRMLGGLMVVVSAVAFAGVTVHVAGEAGLPADGHLPLLLLGLLAALVTFGLGVALLIGRRSHRLP
jgi:hypothetical protein